MASLGAVTSLRRVTLTDLDVESDDAHSGVERDARGRMLEEVPHIHQLSL